MDNATACTLEQLRAENKILEKQLNHLNRNHGELICANSEAQLQLAHSREEVEALIAEVAAANHRAHALEAEFQAKLKEASDEIVTLKTKIQDLCEEKKCFEDQKSKCEEELAALRLLQKESQLKMAKLRREKDNILKENSSLQMDLNSVMTFANHHFKVNKRELSELERAFADFINDSSISDSQLIDMSPVLQEVESFGPETRSDGLVGARCHEKQPIASTMPTYFQSPIDLNISDDDADIPLLKGVKRKLSSSKWGYEADLIEDLRKDARLCMKGVCVLYRQQRLCTLSEINVAKQLKDGDEKTLSDLENDPKAADECRRIALSYSEELFDIYKNGKDPFFARDVTLSQTIM